MQLVQADKSTSTEVIDHHGLVAAVCKDLGLAEKINQRIGSRDPRRIVQPGLAVVAMIINGLGFTNRRLYLTPQFFQSKAISFLFEEEVVATDLNDHALGKSLDEIASYGSSKLYGEIAFELAMERVLLGPRAHHDTTSFSLHGEYDDDEAKEQLVEVTYGYSKDHRPDLKQVMMSLTMTGAANLPVWMEPLNGNSSDKTSFHETINRVRTFQQQLSDCDDFLWIADSALYTPDKLLAYPELYWISRVPENIKACSTLTSLAEEEFVWTKGEEGYQWTEVPSEHGGINQRWLLVFSKQAYEREKKTLIKRIEKEHEQVTTTGWHLEKQYFGCVQEAEKNIEQLNKRLRYHTVNYTATPIEKYSGRGRPNPLTPKVLKGYQLTL